MRNYCIMPARPEDLDGARAVMLDTVYRDFRSGYVPRWHGDIIDPYAAYLAPERHTLLVATAGGGRGDGGGGEAHGGEVVATAALDSRGPAHPPNPRHVAERYPSGTTAQLRRVYVRPEHRRRGLARRLVAELLAFAVADGGYRSVYLHTDPAVEGAEGFWRSLGTVVHDEREQADGGQGIVHFDVPLPAPDVSLPAPAGTATAPDTHARAVGTHAAALGSPAGVAPVGPLHSTAPSHHPPRTGR